MSHVQVVSPHQPRSIMCLLDDDVTSISSESKEIHRSFLKVRRHYFLPATRQASDIAMRFNSLASNWKEETIYQSSLTAICMHPLYQEIIGMGKSALRLIIKDLAREPNHWFWALKAITGIDPVPPTKRGNIAEMTKIWLCWWEKNKSNYA